MVDFFKAPFVPTLFLLYINDLSDDVICNIGVYADETTLQSKCDQASDLWQQLELASELEFDLRDTLDWGRKRLVDFNAEKTQLVWFDRFNNTGAINVKIDGSVLQEELSFEMLVLSSKLDQGCYIIFIAIGALIPSMNFLFRKVALYLYKSAIWPCMSGLVPLVATCNCQISYKCEYAGLLVLHLLPLLNPWLIDEMQPG